jgi:GNAT superfamily N-acetyltransferase
MILLNPADYARVMPLFDTYWYLRPVIYAVLEGTQPGEVLVDDPAQPETAVLWGDFFYLAGDADNDAFNAALVDRITQEAVPNREHILVYGAHERWLAVLPELLGPLGVHQLARSVFAFDADAFRQRAAALRRPLPGGLTLRPLDEATALQVGGIPELWGSVEQFLGHGWGYCVLQGDEFVSSCQTVFVGDGSAEIGVGTREPYRRQGFARAVACATLEEALRRGILPEWGCVYNPASGALGQSLGFTPLSDVPFFYVRGARGRA